jgi:bleomycin hydrolase
LSVALKKLIIISVTPFNAMAHLKINLWRIDSQADGKTTKWRVENSWGDDRGEKGYLLMTQKWFDEFMYEVVVDKKFVPQDVLDVFQKKPVVLPAWDPMGTLAL